eukprot:1471499-Prorocentrum_lima.AAC.1
MTLKIPTWGAQGQPWWMHVVGEARTHHQGWLDLSSREKARLEATICSWTTISYSTHGDEA